MRWLAVFVILAASCTDSPRSGPGGTSRSALQILPIPSAPQLDVLIVVEDSPAMATHGDHVHAAAAALVSTLNAVQGGLPDIHIGVISTDVGVSPGTATIAGCTGTGKHGNLQTSGAPVTGTFVSDIRQNDGTRTKNYTGELDRVVEQMVALGANGCAYPRPLEATRRALADNPANAGFLRPNAYLAVIFLAASDDCSFADGAFLDGATAGDTSRCTTNTAGLTPIDTYVTALEASKSDPTHVVVIGALGDMPARLHAVLGAFPNRSSETTLAGDPAAAFGLITQLQIQLLGLACWPSPLADLDTVAPGLQPACTAELTTPKEAVAVGRCAPGLTKPCYSILEDATNCPDSGALTKLQNFGMYSDGTIRLECLVAESP